MTKQTLGRRNAAPVQSTELDLSSWMLDLHVKERIFCTLTSPSTRGYWLFPNFGRIGPNRDPVIVDFEEHEAR